MYARNCLFHTNSVTLYIIMHVFIMHALRKKLPLTNGANLIEGDSKCPHIRGGGELASSDALYGHPLQRKTTTCLLHIHLLLGVMIYCFKTHFFNI